jgi:hypothetical protein
MKFMGKENNKKLSVNNVIWIVEPKYEWIDQYNEGLAPFCYGGKWGYIDQEFKIIIMPEFDQVLGFSEGLACVKTEGKWGYINREGLMVIKPQFDDLPDSFSEGLVRIAKYDRDINSSREGESISVRSKFGFADLEGNIIIEPQYRNAAHFSEGLASVGDDDKNGYINRYGVFIIEPIFEHALSFCNNKALVCIDQKWGFIENPLYQEELSDFKSDLDIRTDDRQLNEKSKLI